MSKYIILVLNYNCFIILIEYLSVRALVPSRHGKISLIYPSPSDNQCDILEPW